VNPPRSETNEIGTLVPAPAGPTADGVLLVASDVRDVAWSPDGDRIAIASDEGVSLWCRTDSASRWERSPGVPSPSDRAEEARHVCRVGFAPDGRQFAGGDEDGLVHVWETSNGVLRRRLDHGEWIVGLAFDPGGERLAAAGEAGTVRLWDLATGQQRLEVDHGGELTGLAFSPDGRRLATAGRDGAVRVWNVATGAPVLQLDHPCTVWDVAFGPDGRRLATAARDRTVRVWDAASGDETLHLRHGCSLWGRSVQRVAFRPDGEVLASAGCDKTVRLWNAGTGAPLLEIGHGGPADAVAFHPEGRELVTAGGDVRIWDTACGPADGHLGVRTGSLGERMADAAVLLGAAAFGLGVVAVTVVAVAVLLADLLGPWYVDDVARAPDGTIVEAGILDLGAAGEVRVGDCLVEDVPWTTRWVVSWMEGWWGEPIVGVPCDRPHDVEVYAMEALPERFGGAAVDEGDLMADAETICAARFAEYVGVRLEVSELTYRFSAPSDATWTDGQRTVECWLTSRDGTPLVGSMSGRAR
jgi:WD40 repeat protein